MIVSLGWGDRLRQARDSFFVGREVECAQFREFLGGTRHMLFHLHGPGGIGKSTLLHRFMSIAVDEGWQVTLLDGHLVPPEPEAVHAALPALGSARLLVAFDTFERFQWAEGWMRRDFLPSLPGSVRVVLAGRSPLAHRWSTDAGWRDLVLSMSLGDLHRTAAEDFLRRRGVPEGRIPDLVRFSRGHPLTLHLASELVLGDPDRRLDVARTRRVLKPVFDQYLGEVPTRQHRNALYASAVVARTTEPLLASMLEVANATPLFDWLCDRPFMEICEPGISPHDLLRDILLADLGWRDPDLRLALVDRAADYYLSCVEDGSIARLEDSLEAFVFMLRDTPVGQLYHQGEWSDDVYLDRAEPSDLPRLLEMVVRHEGEPAGEIAAYWQQRQPNGLVVLRNAEAEPVGFTQYVDIPAGTSIEEAGAIDPFIRHLSGYLDDNPLRTGELVRIGRIWMSVGAHQSPSPVQVRLFGDHWRKLVFADEVSMSVCVYAHADAWLSRSDGPAKHFPTIDFEVGGLRYGVFGFDFRKTPRARQIKRFQKLIRGESLGDPEEIYAVLGPDEFGDSVKRALRAYWHPNRLLDSPLLQARVVVDRVGPQADCAARVEALRTLLVETCRALGAETGTERHGAVLDRAYFHPELKGLAAADELGMPFSTYRYYVGQGVRRVIETLWRREIGSGREAS